MRLYTCFAILLLSMLLCYTPATAQVITEGPDSVRVLVPDSVAGTSGFFLSRLRDFDEPARAALYAAILPGAGQFYNKAYWKIPIVYATGAVLGYFLIDNNRKYQSFRIALIERADPNVKDEYANHAIWGEQNGTEPGSYAVRNMTFRRDFFRRNRDLTILISIGAYALQIAEAYVHAHLKEFDVSDDLAMRIQPNIIPVASTTNSLAPGLTFTLYTRSK